MPLLLTFYPLFFLLSFPSDSLLPSLLPFLLPFHLHFILSFSISASLPFPFYSLFFSLSLPSNSLLSSLFPPPLLFHFPFILSFSYSPFLPFTFSSILFSSSRSPLSPSIPYPSACSAARPLPDNPSVYKERMPSTVYEDCIERRNDTRELLFGTKALFS